MVTYKWFKVSWTMLYRSYANVCSPCIMDLSVYRLSIFGRETGVNLLRILMGNCIYVHMYIIAFFSCIIKYFYLIIFFDNFIYNVLWLRSPSYYHLSFPPLLPSPFFPGSLHFTLMSLLFCEDSHSCCVSMIAITPLYPEDTPLPCPPPHPSAPTDAHHLLQCSLGLRGGNQGWELH